MKLLPLFLLLAGCAHAGPASPPPPGQSDRATILVARAAAAQETAALHLGTPPGRAAIGDSIVDLRHALVLKPDLPTAVALARAERLAAEGFGSGQERLRGLDDAVRDAVQALELVRPGFEAAMAHDPAAAAAALPPAAAPALSEWVMAVDARARARGLTALLESRPALRAATSRLFALDPTAQHGAGFRLMGTWLASTPAADGGDLGESKAAFEKALSAAPGYLENRVAMAASWAVKAQDRAAYEKLLHGVLEAAPSPPMLENELARRRARELLEGEARRF